MAPSPDAAAAGLVRGTVAWAALRVQTALLDGAAAGNEPLLRAAAPPLLSCADYADVVTERAIADGCGYPACPNPLPPCKAAAAPRFRISLREHRVYDLEEARKFCSERCLVASAAFAASLPSDRPFGVPPGRLDALVALVQSGRRPELGFSAAAGGNKGGQGIKVEIKEKEVSGAGEVTLQDWIGPSDAIEGYVPRRHCTAEGELVDKLSLLSFF
jgi:RNA polymerase II-associated protein 2